MVKLKKIGLKGASCVFSLEVLILVVWNIFDDSVFALVFNIYSLQVIGWLTFKQLGAVLIVVFGNLLYWTKKSMLRGYFCPRTELLSWEWAFGGVMTAEIPKVLASLGFNNEATRQMLYITHNWFWGFMFVIAMSLFTLYLIKSIPKLEGWMERHELLAEPDSIKTIVLSIGIGFYFGLFIEMLVGLPITA
jgi:hypothetical protein